MAGLTLYEKLDQIENRYVEMTSELSSPEILNDSANYQKPQQTRRAFRDGRWPSAVEVFDGGLTEAKQMALEGRRGDEASRSG